MYEFFDFCSLESSLLVPLLEFCALSPSGHVEPRRGLALGWLGSVVAGLAVVFGTADRAQACTSWERTYESCEPDECRLLLLRRSVREILRPWERPRDRAAARGRQCVC